MPSARVTPTIESQISRPSISSGTVSALDSSSTSPGPAGHRNPGGDRRPARDRLRRRAIADGIRAKAGDRLGRRVPETDHAVMVDEEDTVADVREHTLGPLALLPRDPAPRDRRRHRIGHGKQRNDDGEAETDHAPARRARLRVDVGAALQRNEPGPGRTGAEILGRPSGSRRRPRGCRRHRGRAPRTRSATSGPRRRGCRRGQSRAAGGCRASGRGSASSTSWWSSGRKTTTWPTVRPLETKSIRRTAAAAGSDRRQRATLAVRVLPFRRILQTRRARWPPWRSSCWTRGPSRQPAGGRVDVSTTLPR